MDEEWIETLWFYLYFPKTVELNEYVYTIMPLDAALAPCKQRAFVFILKIKVLPSVI